MRHQRSKKQKLNYISNSKSIKNLSKAYFSDL